MKTKIECYQDGFNYSFEHEFTTENENSLNIITGTVLNRFWHYVKVCKQCNAKGLQYNKPINIRITNSDRKIDTGIVNEELQSKLKLQRNNKGMRVFCSRVWAIVKFSVSEITEMDLNTFVETLE